MFNQSFPMLFRQLMHTGHRRCTLVRQSGSAASSFAFAIMLLIGKEKREGIILGLNYHFLSIYLFTYLGA